VIEASAFWVVALGRGELRPERLPAVTAGSARVKTLFSAISRGTEALVFHARVPESEWESMRAPHQVGSFSLPVKYGYANVGRVMQGPPELEGRHVFCLYPHQTEFVVSAQSLVVLPDAVPPERGVLAANLETALNALWDARPLIGDRISVVGGGVVGALVAFLACHGLASDVELVDTNPDRRALAEAFGARFALPEAATPERDLVFHASGSEAGLQTALELAQPEASIIELSWYGDRAVSLRLGSKFHVRRLKLCSSQVGTVSPHARARFTHRERLKLALSLCADSKLDALFERDVAFHELPRIMPEVLSSRSRALCQRVRY